jgi:hypothetical protein
MDLLKELATAIQEEHRLTYESALDALSHAIACGVALVEARKTVPDGQWARWIEENTDFNVHVARRYVRIATHRQLLESAEQRPRSLNAALGYLNELGVPPESTSRTGKRPTFDVELARKLRAQGMTFRDIAGQVGVSDVAVRRQLVPGETRSSMRVTSRARSRRRAERRRVFVIRIVLYGGDPEAIFTTIEQALPRDGSVVVSGQWEEE